MTIDKHFPLASAFDHALARLRMVRSILRDVHDDGAHESSLSCDVRLCMFADFTFQLNWGDVGGDTHHAEWCVEGGLSWDATNADLTRLARSLAQELRDAWEADQDD